MSLMNIWPISFWELKSRGVDAGFWESAMEILDRSCGEELKKLGALKRALELGLTYEEILLAGEAIRAHPELKIELAALDTASLLPSTARANEKGGDL